MSIQAASLVYHRLDLPPAEPAPLSANQTRFLHTERTSSSMPHTTCSLEGSCRRRFVEGGSLQLCARSTPAWAHVRLQPETVARGKPDKHVVMHKHSVCHVVQGKFCSMLNRCARALAAATLACQDSCAECSLARLQAAQQLQEHTTADSM